MALPTLIFELGFAGPDTTQYMLLDDATRGLLDTAQLAGDDVMVDVTGDVLAFTIRRGATQSPGAVTKYDVGTATITLGVTDRRYDPTNLDGPYVVAGASQVVPMRPARIRATWDDVTYSVYTGFTDDYLTEYEDPQWVVVQVPCVDAFAIFQAHDRPAESVAGAGDDTGARIGRILDSISWPAEARDIATGKTTVQETDLSGAALTELQLVNETEVGELYIDADGNVYFRGRDGIITDTRSTVSQAIFGDSGSELPYESAPLRSSAKHLYTMVRITRGGGVEQQASNAASQAQYLTRVYTKSGLLMETDEAALDYASYVLHQSKDPEVCFDFLEIDPRVDPDNLWPQVLGRRIGDRITVRRRPPGGGDAIERDAFIRGIEHTWKEETWRTKWLLQSASKFSFFVLDHASLGMLDSNALAY